MDRRRVGIRLLGKVQGLLDLSTRNIRTLKLRPDVQGAQQRLRRPAGKEGAGGQPADRQHAVYHQRAAIRAHRDRDQLREGLAEPARR